MDPVKLLARLTRGAQANVRFAEMQGLVEAFGFRLVRVSGSHHLYSHPDVDKLVNLQEVGGQAKPYQVRQFLRLVERYGVRLEKR